MRASCCGYENQTTNDDGEEIYQDLCNCICHVEED